MQILKLLDIAVVNLFLYANVKERIYIAKSLDLAIKQVDKAIADANLNTLFYRINGLDNGLIKIAVGTEQLPNYNLIPNQPQEPSENNLPQSHIKDNLQRLKIDRLYRGVKTNDRESGHLVTNPFIHIEGALVPVELVQITPPHSISNTFAVTCKSPYSVDDMQVQYISRSVHTDIARSEKFNTSSLLLHSLRFIKVMTISKTTSLDHKWPIWTTCYISNHQSLTALYFSTETLIPVFKDYPLFIRSLLKIIFEKIADEKGNIAFEKVNEVMEMIAYGIAKSPNKGIIARLLSALNLLTLEVEANDLHAKDLNLDQKLIPKAHEVRDILINVVDTYLQLCLKIIVHGWGFGSLVDRSGKRLINTPALDMANYSAILARFIGHTISFIAHKHIADVCYVEKLDSFMWTSQLRGVSWRGLPYDPHLVSFTTKQIDALILLARKFGCYYNPNYSHRLTSEEDKELQDNALELTGVLDYLKARHLDAYPNSYFTSNHYNQVAYSRTASSLLEQAHLIVDRHLYRFITDDTTTKVENIDVNKEESKE